MNKEIEIIVNDDIYVKTKGLSSYIGKELRMVKGKNSLEDYENVIDYIVNYIKKNNPKIIENQNIGYYSWMLQFRSEDQNYFDIYEVNFNGSGFNTGCDTAISIVKSQSEICSFYKLPAQFPNFNQMVVISKGVYEGKDIEAIRYDSPENMSGWWLITDDYDDNIESLMTVHFYHVAFGRPDILKYLALPFGYRFLMENGNVSVSKD